MPVDRGHDRRGVIEDGKECGGDRGEEAVGVVVSPVEERSQVDARREARARAGEDHRPVDAAKGLRCVFDELEIECVNGWMVDAEDPYPVGHCYVHWLPQMLLGFLDDGRGVAARLLGLL